MERLDRQLIWIRIYAKTFGELGLAMIENHPFKFRNMRLHRVAIT